MTFKFKYKPSFHKNSRISSILPCHMNQFKVSRIMLPYCHVIARSFHNLCLLFPLVVTMSWALLVKVSEKLWLHPVFPLTLVTPCVSPRRWSLCQGSLSQGSVAIQCRREHDAPPSTKRGQKRHKHYRSKWASECLNGRRGVTTRKCNLFLKFYLPSQSSELKTFSTNFIFHLCFDALGI